MFCESGESSVDTGSEAGDSQLERDTETELLDREAGQQVARAGSTVSLKVESEKPRQTNRTRCRVRGPT